MEVDYSKDFLVDQINQLTFGSVEPTKYSDVIHENLSNDYDLEVFKKFDPFSKYILNSESDKKFVCFIGVNTDSDTLIFAVFDNNTITTQSYTRISDIPIVKCTSDEEELWNEALSKLSSS